MIITKDRKIIKITNNRKVIKIRKYREILKVRNNGKKVELKGITNHRNKQIS